MPHFYLYCIVYLTCSVHGSVHSEFLIRMCFGFVSRTNSINEDELSDYTALLNGRLTLNRKNQGSTRFAALSDIEQVRSFKLAPVHSVA